VAGKIYMCGRFSQKFTWQEVVGALGLNQTPRNIRPNYNVCPTDPISVVIPSDNGLFLVPMRWGLVPRWWKKSLKELPATFNARSETVADKPMFRDAFKRSRCLIPASGYFEWQTVGKDKQPYYFTPRNGSVLTFAGLWDEWNGQQRNHYVLHYTDYRAQFVRQRNPRPNAS
jgi:putative SOS response-associated peptidase YedK